MFSVFSSSSSSRKSFRPTIQQLPRFCSTDLLLLLYLYPTPAHSSHPEQLYLNTTIQPGLYPTLIQLLQLQFGHNLHIPAQQKLKLKPGNCETERPTPPKHGQKHSTTTANSSFALVAFCIPLHASSIVGLFSF
jgi:hypothetical protein